MSTLVNDVFALWPGYNRLSGALSNLSAHIVDAESEKVEWIFQVPKTGAIQYVGIAFWQFSVKPTANVDIRIETVNTTTGNATGTLWDTNTNYSWDASSAADYQFYKLGPLTANASVSQGNLVALVYVPPASPNNGNVSFLAQTDESYGFPYSRHYNGASWSAGSHRAHAVLVYTDGTITGIDMHASGGYHTLAFNSTDTYDHLGATLRSSVSLEVVGMWAYLDLDQDSTLKLISGSNTVERTCALESDYRPNTDPHLVYGYFSSSFTMQSGTDYKFVAYTAATSDIAIIAPLIRYSGESSITLASSLGMNWFTNIDGQEGELSTPTWQSLDGDLPLIGPIVRSIG